MRLTTRRNFLQTAAGIAALNAKAAPSLVAEASGGSPARLRLRGLTVDAARLPERLSYYLRLIDFCQEWGLNALLFRLTDDQGSMLRFRGYPELITHHHALTPEAARELAAHGERKGVTVIPEIESFGHTRYITAAPKYAHLEDSDPAGQRHFGGLIPVAPETLSLIGGLYREAAALFPSPYLHGGCDEVNWGGSELSRRALLKRSRAEIWAEYLNSLDDACHKLGKQLIVWGDFVVHKEPQILPRLNQRVIVMDWQYYVTNPKPLAQVAETVIAHGHGAIGAPAIISCEWGPRAGQQQLRNIDAYADAYSGIRSARNLGVVVTNWVPSRYFERSLWDSFAYAASALNDGSAAARESAFRKFIEKFYGAGWSSNWQEIFSTYYRITPNRHSCAPQWQGPRLPVPWVDERGLRAALNSSGAAAPPFAALRERIRRATDTVRRNSGDFSAFALSAEYLEYAFWRNSAIEASAKAPEAQARHLIGTLSERDRSMVTKLDAEWSIGRFPDERGKLQQLTELGPADQLLFRMGQAATFSASLAKEPSRFSTMLRRKGG
ncbi:MAG: family 20 glycosylhydrolase [Terriglobia bacterium]